ncbi:response regulator [Stappia sp.]|uniref:response regulator n=1 Tax=Stappia sp. TaxID=1870903 RepID=UPI0032D96B43
MTRHYAYGLDISDLDVVVVDDSKPMQAILRSTLLGFRVRRVRTYDTADEAVEVMRLDPPNFVITDWRMRPTSGIALLRNLRQRRMAPLCFLPVIFVTAHGTRTVIDRILRDGAQNVLIKPVSPSALHERIAWTLRDDRPLVMGEQGRYVIDGVADMLDAKARKWQQLGAQRALTGERPARSPARAPAAPAAVPDIILPDSALRPRAPETQAPKALAPKTLSKEPRAPVATAPADAAPTPAGPLQADARPGSFAKVKRVRHRRGIL